jgi:hypothetical protein
VAFSFAIHSAEGHANDFVPVFTRVNQRSPDASTRDDDFAARPGEPNNASVWKQATESVKKKIVRADRYLRAPLPQQDQGVWQAPLRSLERL